MAEEAIVGSCRPRRTILLAIPVVVLLASCQPNGTNYGWVQIYGGSRATCGRQDILPITSQAGYVTGVRGRGTTWLEVHRDTVCNASTETGERYLAAKGWLGNSVRVRENGVTCAFNSMSYNAQDAYYLTSDATCPNDFPTDQYRTDVVHRWWSVDRSVYAQVTASSPTLNL